MTDIIAKITNSLSITVVVDDERPRRGVRNKGENLGGPY